MTTEQLAEYYASLLIIQYATKAKAAATVRLSVTPVIADQITLAIQDGFSLETAVGLQLDVVAKYIGVARSGYSSQGIPILLNDADFKQLIKLVLIKNNAGSSLATIQTLLAASFPGQILVSDNQSMGLNYVLLESLGTSDLLELLVTGGYLPAPMGVETSIVIIPAHTDPFFGFRTYDAPDSTIAPFNSYDFINTHSPWLTY